MQTNPKELYVDLLKRTVSGAVYPDPPMPVIDHWCRRGYIKKFFAPIITKVLGKFGASLCFDVNYSVDDVEQGKVLPVQSYSMIGRIRIDNLTECVETVLRENVPGDLIETGVWRGGACILMRGLLKVNGVTDRKVYVADSFCGLPEPDAESYPADEGDVHHTYTYLEVSKVQVMENFKRLGLLDDQVVFLQGWFKDTLPTLPDRPMAIIRLDGDMYESTMDAFTHLYHRLSPGGFCIIDDYMIPSCRQAVQDFREKNGINENIEPIDEWSVFWRKSR